MQHAFQLAAPLAFADIERLTNALCALPGVQGIDMRPGGRQVDVQFDERATSPDAIAATALRAGYPEAGAQVPGASCCGCCGG